MPKAYIVEKQTAMVRRIVSDVDAAADLLSHDSDFPLNWQDVKGIDSLDDVFRWFRLWPKNWLAFAPGRRSLHIYKVYGWGDYTGRVFCGKSFLDEAPRLLPLCRQCLNFFRISVLDEISSRKHRPAHLQALCESRRAASYA